MPKMKLTADKRALVYNEFLTLEGIPEVFDYKLGNRSALEWVIDQYEVRVLTSKAGLRTTRTATTMSNTSCA